MNALFSRGKGIRSEHTLLHAMFFKKQACTWCYTSVVGVQAEGQALRRTSTCLDCLKTMASRKTDGQHSAGTDVLLIVQLFFFLNF